MRAVGMRVVRAAMHLGVEVGPGAVCAQSASVMRKMSARVPDIATARASISVHVQGPVRGHNEGGQVYAHAIQCITNSLWQAWPTKFLCGLKGLRYPVEARDIHIITFVSKAQTLQRSQIWNDMEPLIAEQGECDEARLNPNCDRHATSVISTLRVTQARLRALPPQIREVADEATGRRFNEQNMEGGRMGVILPVLQRRARRWSEQADEVVQAVIAFSASKPPPELLTSVLRTLLYA